ncbi:MAG: helix-turn-helix domain-containing protein [Gemmatimonadales bacterium]
MLALDDGGRHRAAATILAAPRHLESFVEHLWVEDVRPARHPALRRIVPDHAPHLIWHRFGGDSGQLTVIGARTRAQVIDVTRRTVTVGARLRPGALRILMNRPANVFTDHSLPIAYAFALPPALLHDLESAPFQSIERALSLMSATLEHLARPSVATDARIVRLARLLGDHGDLPQTIAGIVSTLRVPERTVRAWSLSHFGMAPKQILRIRRLHRAIELHMASPAEPWSSIAFSAGFADQAHLIRDCRALLGVPPLAFMRGAGPA